MGNYRKEKKILILVKLIKDDARAMDYYINDDYLKRVRE